MSEPNTAGAQGTTNESTQGTNAANAGTAGNAAEKTFTQAEVDRIVQNRLAADRASQPNDDELRAYRHWKATGRYCLEQMGFTNITYHAYEIDPYPIKVAMDNYPDIIQHGDAFAVRNDDWKPPQTRSEWLKELWEV